MLIDCSFYSSFLLLAKRSTWHQCIIEDRRPTDRPTDQRPSDLAFWKISNCHISATDHSIYLMYGSRVGFSGWVHQMALHPVGANPRCRLHFCKLWQVFLKNCNVWTSAAQNESYVTKGLVCEFPVDLKTELQKTPRSCNTYAQQLYSGSLSDQIMH